MDRLKQIEGTLTRLLCASCKQTFPHFVFADNTELGAVSSAAANEVAIAAMTPLEWAGFKSGAPAFAARVAQQLGRSDLHFVRLLRVEKSMPPKRGISFQEFRKNYVAPRLVYACICCRGGESRPVEELTVEEFRSRGGQVSLLGPLTLSRPPE